MSSLSVLLCLSLCMLYRWHHSCQSVCPSVNSYISVLLLWVTVLEYWPLLVIGLHHPTYWQYACNVYSDDTTLAMRAKTHGSPRRGGSVQWRSGRMAGILRAADALLHCKRRQDGQETSRYLAQRLWSSHISAGLQPGVSRKAGRQDFRRNS